MTKLFVLTMACLLVIGTALADEHPSEHPKPKPAAAGRDALDGKVFVGQLVKAGETTGDKDQLTFKGGKFVSSACVQYGFHETAYTATEKDGVVTFTAKATNADGETMSWSGTLKQGVLDGTAVNTSKSGATTYTFKGTAGPADAKDQPKKSEHPEHPKK
jgi:hypothetical protein